MNIDSSSIPKSPPLIARWFHAIDSPIIDPIALRKAKREKSLASIALRSGSISSNTSSTTPVRVPPKQWVPFSKRDTMALEKAFKENYATTVSVNEDYLFQVDIGKREISPVYWEGPTYEVRRGTWFMQGDFGKWLPCEENLSRQIEQGYQKYRPYIEPTVIPETPAELELGDNEILEDKVKQKEKDIGDTTNTVTDVPEKKEPEQILEEKEFLLGPYLGQYVIYTDASNAWLLDDTPSAKMAKNILTKLTNNQNLGGTKLLRGYLEVEREKKKKNEENKKTTTTTETIVDPIKKVVVEEVDCTSKVALIEEKETRQSLDTGDLSRKTRNISPSKKKELDEIQMMKQQAEDYDNEESEEEVRNIDQVIFVIHGIGQQMSERLGQNFVHDVNIFRKTLKSTWPIAVGGISSLDRPNGIQVLPILWRKGMLFGSESTTEEGFESDLGLPDGDDGCPTIDEITLDGAPNIRTLVSDVFLDIPLYLTSRYHGQMMNIVIKEVNRVYKLFIERNPHFLKNNGQVSILAHSLGSLLAFDILTAQPFTDTQLSNVTTTAAAIEKRSATLDFPVKNFFAIGSPLGMIMILRGHKMVSRKTLENATTANNHTLPAYHDKSAPVSFVYPATDNIYNIFHKSDPVAYRLEPLVVRHYGTKLKPFPIPYIKGGLKSVLDHSYNVTHDFANRAGAMFESIRSNFTDNLIMRGLGFSKPADDGAYPGSELQQRSNSDPSILASRAEAKSAAKLKLLNPSGRIDFYLQEGLLENTYISALSVHMSYWQDVDVAGFLTREVYKNQQLEQEQ